MKTTGIVLSSCAVLAAAQGTGSVAAAKGPVDPAQPYAGASVPVVGASPQTCAVRCAITGLNNSKCNALTSRVYGVSRAPDGSAPAGTVERATYEALLDMAGQTAVMPANGASLLAFPPGLAQCVCTGRNGRQLRNGGARCMAGAGCPDISQLPVNPQVLVSQFLNQLCSGVPGWVPVGKSTPRPKASPQPAGYPGGPPIVAMPKPKMAGQPATMPKMAGQPAPMPKMAGEPASTPAPMPKMAGEPAPVANPKMAGSPAPGAPGGAAVGQSTKPAGTAGGPSVGTDAAPGEVPQPGAPGGPAVGTAPPALPATMPKMAGQPAAMPKMAGEPATAAMPKMVGQSAPKAGTAGGPAVGATAPPPAPAVPVVAGNAGASAMASSAMAPVPKALNPPNVPIAPSSGAENPPTSMSGAMPAMPKAATMPKSAAMPKGSAMPKGVAMPNPLGQVLPNGLNVTANAAASATGPVANCELVPCV